MKNENLKVNELMENLSTEIDDCIFIGEIKGQEALDLFTSTNINASNAKFSIHSNAKLSIKL